MDRGAWWATIYGGLKESDTSELLSLHITSYKQKVYVA